MSNDRRAEHCARTLSTTLPPGIIVRLRVGLSGPCSLIHRVE